MLFSRTAQEIRNGLWAVSPYHAQSSLQLALKILAGETREETSHKIEASISYTLDVNGNKQSHAVNEIPPDSVGVIEIVGNMIKYGNYYCWGADELVAIASMYDAHPNIIGQVWIIDSGGGSVGAVGPYHDFLMNKKKPVVAHCDLCASAAYWTACNTDYVMAQNNISAMFGSIGVMANFMSYKKYFKELGIEEHTVYSDMSEDKNKEYEEAMDGKYKLMKELLLNPLAKQFQDMVTVARGNKLDTSVKGILSGRMFFTEDSIENGLADGVGTLEDAFQKVKNLAAVQSLMSS